MSDYKVGDCDTRPWGHYIVMNVDVNDQDEDMCEKIIIVKPGKILSLQSHDYRREFWTVKDGTLDVILDGEHFKLKRDESVRIPEKALHCMANFGVEPCIVYERQEGFCSESDIKRYSDAYGRATDIDVSDDRVISSLDAYQELVAQTENENQVLPPYMKDNMKGSTMRKFLTSLAFLSLLPFAAAHAGNMDDGLYAPTPPDGSAFVRFINASADDSLKPEIKSKQYDSIAAYDVGPYVPVKAGSADLKIGSGTATQELKEGGYYTAALKGNALDVVEDQPLKNQTKAMVTFYNLGGSEPLSLKTSDGKVAVINDVAPGAGNSREINGVPVKLAVYKGDEKVADVGSVALKRGQGTTVVVTDEGGALKAEAVPTKTDTTQ